jgi:hypothetical protein
MWVLWENPMEWAKSKGISRTGCNLAEEAVRWTTQVKHFVRSAGQDEEMNGQLIGEGQ